MAEQYYVNPGLARKSPVPFYEESLIQRSSFPGNPVMRSPPALRPPEDAWKNYEIQELYDELNRYRRADEAHAKWRLEVESKWKQSEELARKLNSENKMLKEENARLKMSLQSNSRPLRPRTQNTPNPDLQLHLELDAMRKENREMKRVISYPPPAGSFAELSKRCSEMSNEIKTLNFIVQQLNEDKTDLIQKRNRAEEDAKVLRENAKKQEFTLNEYAGVERDLRSELTTISFQTNNLKNENANLNLLLRERI